MTMSTTKHKEQDFAVANGHVPSDKKEKDVGKMALPKKVFITRNSILTDLMEVNHLQSMYNISVAVCFLLFLNAVIYYLATPHKFWRDINIVRWCFGNFHIFLAIWTFNMMIAYAVFEGFKLWVAVRKRIHLKVADAVFIFLYLGSIIFMYATTAHFVLSFKMPPVTGFATMCEQVRIFMKFYSFVKESAPRVLQYKPEKDGSQEHVLYPSTRHYFYYLFAPVLIYKDSYPRTEKIHWNIVFNNLFKFLSVIFITYCALMRFNVDMFQNVGLQQFTRTEAALMLAGAMAVGAIMMFLLFYGILHCWLNFAAELTRFGDRQFYQDWWNSTSFSQYYRRWNNVVYDWLHVYIYVETQKFGCKRSVSLVLVFFLSALVHEYIICLSLGFFYPVLCVVYSTIGVFLVFFTKQRTSQFWNIYMWGMLFAGWGVVITCYSSEWFARINCPKEETALDFFIPRSWDPSCHIFNFS